MNRQSLFGSTEFWTGLGLVGTGLAAPFFGFHDLFAQALAPFGVGLILSDALSGVGRSGGLRVRLRSRRDE